MNGERSSPGEIRRRKKNWHNKNNIPKHLSEFSEETRTHFFHYIFDTQLSWTERIYWLIICCISLIISTMLIIKVYNQSNQPVIQVNFAEKPTPVWQVPFPAITICSETKTKQREYNFTYYYHQVLEHLQNENESNLTDEELRIFGDTSLICDNHLYQEGPKFTDFETIDRLIKIAPSFSEIFWTCKFTNMNESCDTLFSPMLTEDGICFTFNMLDRKELFTDAISLPEEYMEQGRESEGWTLDGQYPKDLGKDTYPRRAISTGSRAGMLLLLQAYEQDLDYICRGPVPGFKVLLHHPAETPRIASHYFRAPLNQEIVVSIKPNLITTSPELRKYAPHQRYCYFSDERPLKFFKIYTQHNCQIECLANYTLAKCECVAYHMPHDKETKLCGPGSTQCVFEAHQELLTREVEAGIDLFESDDFENSPLHCKCLPPCTSITYDTEVSQADFQWQKIFQAFKADFNEFPGVQITRLTLFFKDLQFTSTQRREFKSSTDFLSSCGGLLALFTGFSLLTIVEIIYFLTLRLICKKRLSESENFADVTLNE